MWHQRLLIYSYVSLQLGLLKNNAVTERIKAKLVGRPPSADDRECTNADNEDVRKLRDACSNSIHFACLVLSDKNMHRACRIVCRVLAPSRMGPWRNPPTSTPTCERQGREPRIGRKMAPAADFSGPLATLYIATV